MNDPSPHIEFVRMFNRWRRGENIEPPEPKRIGEALDGLCDYAESLERELNDVRKLLADESRDSLEIANKLFSTSKLCRKLGLRLQAVTHDSPHLGPINEMVNEAIAENPEIFLEW